MASRCTLVTRGQVASMTWSPRCFASWRTAGDTPWALKITVASSGTSWSSSTKCAPLARSASTTCRLCTISRRTYTGGGHTCSASSTMSMARSTPAQKPRGPASTISCNGKVAIVSSGRGRLDQYLERQPLIHESQRLAYLAEGHGVGQEPIRHQAARLEQRDRLPDQRRRVVKGSDQRQFFVVRPSRVHPHGRTRRATTEEYHGPSTADSCHGLLPHLGTPGSVHDHVDAGASRCLPQERGEVRASRGVETLRDTEPPHLIEPPARLADKDHPRATLRGHQSEEAAERSVPDHRHAHAALHASALDSQERTSERLREGGAPRGQRGREAHHVGRDEARGQRDVLAVGAVDEEEIFAKVFALHPAEAAGAARGGVRRHHAVPFPERRHATPDARHRARELVAEHRGHVRDHDGMAAPQHLDVGSAGERGLHAHDQLARRRLRHGNVLEAQIAGTVEDLRPHGRMYTFTASRRCISSTPRASSARGNRWVMRPSTVTSVELSRSNASRSSTGEDEYVADRVSSRW